LSYLGPVWGRGLSLYLALLPKYDKDTKAAVRYNVRKVFYGLDLERVKDQDLLVWVLGQIDEIAKKWGDLLFPGYWKYMTYWNTLGDFVEMGVDEKATQKMREELQDWVQVPRIHTFKGKSWYPWFKEEIRNFLFNAPNKEKVTNDDVPNLDEYVADLGYLGRSGSTHLPGKVTIEEGLGRGEKVKYFSGKNKWVSALMRGKEETKNMLTNAKTPRYKIVFKREQKKIRPVVSAPDHVFAQMDFISQWLDKAMQGYDISTLFMSSTESLKFWKRASDLCGSGYVNIPLDQTNFDHQTTLEMLIICFEVIEEFVIAYAPSKVKEQYIHVLSVIKEELTERKGDLNFEGEFIDVQKGILSGWKWTAFIDTMVNYGEVQVAKRILNDWNFDNTGFVDLNVQGDDDKVSVRSYGTAVGLALAYTEMGIPINPSKFFIDQYRDEYLRKLITEKQVVGYPARGIGAVLYAGALSRPVLFGETRLRDRFKAWNTLIARGLDKKLCYEHMLRDMSRATAIPRDIILRWMHTPSIYGGLGLRPLSKNWVEITDSERDERWRVLSDLPGLQKELGHFGMSIEESEVQRTLRSIVPNTKSRFNLIKGEVKDRAWVIPKWDAMSGIPVKCSPVWKENTKILQSAYISKMMRLKEYGKVEDLMIDTSRIVSQRIFAKSKAVWIDWVNDRLPNVSPCLIGYGDLQVSVYGNEYREKAFGYWVNKYAHSADYHLIRRCFLKAESTTITRVRSDDWVFSN
jgi:hypothetical protein